MLRSLLSILFLLLVMDTINIPRVFQFVAPPSTQLVLILLLLVRDPSVL